MTGFTSLTQTAEVGCLPSIQHQIAIIRYASGGGCFSNDVDSGHLAGTQLAPMLGTRHRWSGGGITGVSYSYASSDRHRHCGTSPFTLRPSCENDLQRRLEKWDAPRHIRHGSRPCVGGVAYGCAMGACK